MVPVSTNQFNIGWLGKNNNLWCKPMWVCLKMSCTPINPMVLLIIIPIKWGNIPYFQTNPCINEVRRPNSYEEFPAALELNHFPLSKILNNNFWGFPVKFQVTTFKTRWIIQLRQFAGESWHFYTFFVIFPSLTTKFSVSPPIFKCQSHFKAGEPSVSAAFFSSKTHDLRLP